MNRPKPSYLKLYENGQLSKRISTLHNLLNRCRLCPRECDVNRLEGKLGYCCAGKNAVVSSFFPHFGEEAPLVGKNGSGTIFLAHCNLRCVFCQNHEISHFGQGEEVSSFELAEMMYFLQQQGCHNINFVTPTHFVPQIIESLPHAIKMGLNVPLVYNCSGYDPPEVLKLLKNIIDIYLPDAKFAREDRAIMYVSAADYFTILKEALKEMQNQVGVLITDTDGIAWRGVLIRHLVMPGSLEESREILQFISQELSRESYVNIMKQYHPSYRAHEYQALNRCVSSEEYRQTLQIAAELGLYRLFE